MKGLNRLFNPKTIVVVGASNKPGKVGYEIIKNLVNGGFQGEIYGLNPKGGKAFGVKFYKDVDELPENIDLALFATAGKISIEVLSKLANRGLGSAVIYASGFAEIGNKELQERLENIINKFNVRIIGPNCAGIVNNLKNLYASFVPGVENGPIAMASQSGAFSAVVTNYLRMKGLGLASLATLGNKVDVDEVDFISFFSRYPEVKSFILYIEGFKEGEGRRLAKIIKDIDKPVVILKGGISEETGRALYSHTASLTGDIRIIENVLMKSGAYLVYDYIELVDVAEASAYLKPPKGPEIALVTNGGGPGVIAVDHLTRLGHHLNETPRPVYNMLDHLKPYMVRSNPIDLTADGDEEYYYHTIANLLKAEWPDVIYVLHVPPSFVNPYKIAEAVGEAFSENPRKPVIPLFMGVDTHKISEKLHKYGLPAPSTHRSASMAVDYLIRRRR